MGEFNNFEKKRLEIQTISLTHVSLRDRQC